MARGGAGGGRRREERDDDGAVDKLVERQGSSREIRSHEDDRGGDGVDSGVQEADDEKRALDGRGLFGERGAGRHGHVVSDNYAIKGCMFPKGRQAWRDARDEQGEKEAGTA